MQALVKMIAPAPSPGFGLSDLRTVRVGDGQSADVRLGAVGSPSAGVGRLSFQAAQVRTGAAQSTVSLNGLRCWLAEQSAAASKDADFAANINLTDGKAAIVVQSGVRKPVVVIVRASITRY